MVILIRGWNRIRVPHYSFSRAAAGFLVILSFLTHCAGPQAVREEEEKVILRDRINQYWQYRIKGDVERAYQFEVPAFREKVSILQYVNRFKLVKYVDAEVQDVEVKGREASNSLKLTYHVFLKRISEKTLSKITKEKWVKIESTWYHVPEDFEMKKNDLKG